MPRAGDGSYSLPSGSTAVSGATATASQHNTPLQDLAQDANTARPVAYGGTGATTASGARGNLSAQEQGDVLDDLNTLGAASAAGKIIAASGAGAFAYRDTIGTVSESSGVPTGALIEQGSNANGEYVRFADGTQICWHDGHAVTASAATLCSGIWTFPAQFSAVPTAVFNLSLKSADWTDAVLRSDVAGCGPFTVTANAATVGFFFISGADTVTVSNNHVTAVGRWF